MINKTIEININKLKIFGLVIETEEITYLSIQCAESLEEAFALARLEFAKINAIKNNEIPKTGGKIVFFTIKTIDRLLNEGNSRSQTFNDYFNKEKEQINKINKINKIDKIDKINKIDKIDKKTVEIKKEKPNQKDIKNNLMKSIITNKDIEKFNKNKKLFNENERSYLKDILLDK